MLFTFKEGTAWREFDVSPDGKRFLALVTEGLWRGAPAEHRPELDGGGRNASPPVRKGTRLGPYEILAPVGSGGMREVYRATDPRLGREVAIKVLSAELSPDA